MQDEMGKGAKLAKVMCVITLLVVVLLGGNTVVRAEQRAIPDASEVKMEQFVFTDVHRKLLKEARIVWDPTENGAPTFHPSEPFGSEDVYGDIAKITGLVSVPLAPRWSIFDRFLKPRVKLTAVQQGAAEQFLIDLFPATEILLQNGQLAAGDYTLTVKEPSSFLEELSQVDFFGSEKEGRLVLMSAPTATDGARFSLTDEHKKLLRLAALFLRGNSRGLIEEKGHLDVPALHPKRPYGDMAYYPLDIARELGVPIDNKNYEDDDESKPFELEKLGKLVELHLQMLQAMILFLAEAKVETGRYVKHGEIWRKTS